MKLIVDHIYTRDQNHKFLKKLEKMGFQIDPATVKHPGGLTCRFITFRDEKDGPRKYLEFASVSPDPKARQIRCPGISFSTTTPIGKVLERKLPQLKKHGLRFKFKHLNYEWKDGDQERGPGWNFVEFPNLGFRTLYPWITEYEPNPNKPTPKRPKISHPNGIRGIAAIEIEINQAGRRFFERLLSRPLSRPVQIASQPTLYFTEGKRTAIRSIILEASDPKKLVAFSFDDEIRWRGRAARLITNPNPNMWDLIVIAT